MILKYNLFRLSSADFFFSSHSHITRTLHPADLSARWFSMSRSTFLVIFCFQYSSFEDGHTKPVSAHTRKQIYREKLWFCVPVSNRRLTVNEKILSHFLFWLCVCAAYMRHILATDLLWVIIGHFSPRLHHSKPTRRGVWYWEPIVVCRPNLLCRLLGTL